MVISTLFIIQIAKAESFGKVTVSKIVRVYDGDTFFANIDGWPPLIGKVIGVRVAGIDTPELRTKSASEKQRAIEARALASKMLRGATVVELCNIRRDKYFRILADVHVDGQNLAEVLIRNQLARPYDGGTKQIW